jgi:hypothetical protein
LWRWFPVCLWLCPPSNTQLLQVVAVVSCMFVVVSTL